MNIATLKASLQAHPAAHLRLVLPDGESVPAEFHVTEVGHVTRRFIDCGGTVRAHESCLLQAWVSERDAQHRLTAGKLAKILDLARPLLPSDDLAVEVEYEACELSQYTVDEVSFAEGELRFTLGAKHTACLARETCEASPTASGCGCGSTAGACC